MNMWDLGWVRSPIRMLLGRWADIPYDFEAITSLNQSAKGVCLSSQPSIWTAEIRPEVFSLIRYLGSLFHQHKA